MIFRSQRTSSCSQAGGDSKEKVILSSLYTIFSIYYLPNTIFQIQYIIHIFVNSEVEQDNFGDNGSFEIIYELDLETETFELIQVFEKYQQ